MKNDFHEEFGRFVVTNDTGSFSDRHIIGWIKKEKEESFGIGLQTGALIMGICAIILMFIFG